MNRFDVYYNKITNQPSDIEADYRDDIMKNEPVKFDNQLHIDIVVYHEQNSILTRSPGMITQVGTVKSKKILSIDGNNFFDGDIFHFVFVDEKKNQHFVCPSCYLIKRQGTIKIGCVVSFTESFKRDIHPGGDVSSIVLHNLLPFQIIIKPKNSKNVIKLDANPYLGHSKHHGDFSMAPYVYYDDMNNGIKLDSKYDVFIGNEYLYSFELNDIDIHHIFIGATSKSVGQQVSTGGNAEINSITHTGRIKYRMAEGRSPVMPGGITAGVSVPSKNFPGTDKHRANLTLNKNHKERSTVPTARYIKLSGENTACGISIIY